MLGPFATASRLTPIHQVSLAVLSRATCASMSTTTRQRQRVTEGTAMAPWNGPNKLMRISSPPQSRRIGLRVVGMPNVPHTRCNSGDSAIFNIVMLHKNIEVQLNSTLSRSWSAMVSRRQLSTVNLLLDIQLSTNTTITTTVL